MISPMDISASALSAQRTRMNVLASNIANAHTTRDEYGNISPYRRQEVLFAPRVDDGEVVGVRVTRVREAAHPFQWVYQPDHPDAVKDLTSENHGRVLMPKINVVQEMVDMMMASRAYEANLTAMEATKAIGASVARIIG
jgi:flagellar basal-body rod protein FlgC